MSNSHLFTDFVFIPFICVINGEIRSSFRSYFFAFIFFFVHSFFFLLSNYLFILFNSIFMLLQRFFFNNLYFFSVSFSNPHLYLRRSTHALTDIFFFSMNLYLFRRVLGIPFFIGRKDDRFVGVVSRYFCIFLPFYLTGFLVLFFIP